MRQDTASRVGARRKFLGTASAGVMLAAAGSAFAQVHAQPTPRAKGRRVWLELDQKDLDDASDQRVYAPNQPQVMGRYATNSEITRARLGPPRRFAYGPAPVEGLDVFAARSPNAPVNVFIHGGAWRGGEAKNYAFPAEMFVNAGAHFVVLDFIAIREAGGDLRVMAEQVRRGIAWVHKNASSFGGDASRLYIGGHSSGGHLCGVALVTDWEKDHALPADAVKGGPCMRRMFDMTPGRRLKRSSYV